MPILYVHGVNTRSREGFFAIEPLLRRHVAPEWRSGYLALAQLLLGREWESRDVGQ